MKILSVKSLLVLGVALAGLVRIALVFVENSEGMILGDSSDGSQTMMSGSVITSPLQTTNQTMTTSQTVSSPVSTSETVQVAPSNQEQHIVQEIVIPKTIESTTSQSIETSTGGVGSIQQQSENTTTTRSFSEGLTDQQRERKNTDIMRHTVNQERNGGDSSIRRRVFDRTPAPLLINTAGDVKVTTEVDVKPLLINTAGDVKVTTEVDVKPHEAIKEAGFYSRGFSGQENYLGEGREIAKGVFQYQGDLSRQLSNGDQEILFKSKKETVGRSGERLISEETKSIPVIVDVPGNMHEVFAVQEKKKQDLLSELEGQKGISPERIAELKSVSAENIPFVKEAENSDFDQDGLTNAEERRLGTNPFLADTDNDGFLDGDEVKSGYDPKKFSPGDGRDKIAFENPKDVIEAERRNPEKKTENSQYVVSTVSSVKASTLGEKDKLRFSGKALPNIFVTLYIYSDPIVVSVKTDANGNWSYDLDRTIDDGSHEVYVAVTDNTGKITARSEGLGFVKTASAITIQPVASAAEMPLGNQSPFDRSLKEYLFVACIAVLFFSGAALMIIGRRREIDVK